MTPLQQLLEREFDLKYYGGFSIEEVRKIGVKEIAWFHGRLKKQVELIVNGSPNNR